MQCRCTTPRSYWFTRALRIGVMSQGFLEVLQDVQRHFETVNLEVSLEYGVTSTPTELKISDSEESKQVLEMVF